MKAKNLHPSKNSTLSQTGTEKFTHSHDDVLAMAQNLKSILLDGDTYSIYARAQRFYQKLEKHIQEEDSPDGLLIEIEKRVPQLFPRLENLRKQHREILADLKMICADVDEELAESAIPMIDDCLKLVAQHEQEEERLIEETL